MKKLSTFVVVLGVSLSGLAYAQPDSSQQPTRAPGKVQLTEAQMDRVTAGASDLIDVDVVVTKNEIVKNTQVGVSAAVAVLGVAGSALKQRQ
jgi:hypothetical protein